ncbi:MAG: 16S rRNA (uracil(1498)-N(3))-methyltransferase [Calditrichaeota bacterium]|nr:MAG: 16S rRNA (uracil(1498)-N(3))-methyltransferase [Calditrichota bacterium]
MTDLFYTDQFKPDFSQFILSAEESHHIMRVLRKKTGDNIELTDGKGHRIHGRIGNQQERQLVVEVEAYDKQPFPVENRIEIAISIIRPNRMDWAVEKLVELGVEKITPLTWHYTNYKNLKADHLKKIIINAMKQSHQYYIPEIKQVITGEEWLKQTKEKTGLKLIAHPGTDFMTSPSRYSARTGNIHIAIGPEGGFDETELQLARNSNFYAIALSQTVLRTETAAIAAVSQLKLLYRKL